MGGLSGAAFSWYTQTQALTSGTGNVIASTVYNAPHLKFTGSITGARTTVTLPATDGAFWVLDFSAVNFNTSNSLTIIINGNTWGTTILTANQAGQFLIYYWPVQASRPALLSRPERRLQR